MAISGKACRAAAHMPVIVGVGQLMRRWSAHDGTDLADAPSPHGLRAAAARLALADSGAGEALTHAIDQIIVIRTMADSVPGAPQIFGRAENPPGTLAAALGIALEPDKLIYSHVGGDQPQALISEAAAAIWSGEKQVVLIAGAEATGAMKAAHKDGVSLDWHQVATADFTDRGYGTPLLSRYARTNGLGAPTTTYPAFEQALAHRWGHDSVQHRAAMSGLWAAFSRIAATHPQAQFPQIRDVDFLSLPSGENFPIADPYLKWDVAQDAVNQGAALVMISSALAERLQIPAAKYIYLHGAAAAKDVCPTMRADLSQSVPTQWALGQAMDAAQIMDARAIAYIDLYSCFPVAVFLAAEALGIDWRAEAQRLTLTGGLPFFGGAGNNYSLHAIATLVERLRGGARGAYGLILANGGFLSKEAAGVYAAHPPAEFQAPRHMAAEHLPDGPPLLAEDCAGHIESWSVGYRRGEAADGYAFVRTASGGRALAKCRAGDAPRFSAHAAAAKGALIGTTQNIRHQDGVNYLDFDA
ncbi:MAG: hypothetical protein IT553_02920 [Sphingomonadaceae bacterium]|nr:hypothetical protein [Sphingomonadaceae bacterium]